LRKTKIVATIGPASESPEIIRQMIKAGVDVARFNFSHGSHEVHKRWMQTVLAVSEELGVPVALMADTKGPEIRLGKFTGGSAVLKDGQTFVMSTEEVQGTGDCVFVQYPGILQDVSPGSPVYLDDGNITMEVQSVAGNRVVCTVKSGGIIRDGKKVNLPGSKVSLPALSDKDVDDLKFAVEMGCDFVAASFVRRARDILDIRRVIEEAGGDMHIIAKIENMEGVENLDAILRVADGLMVARGDLGVEVPTEDVPIIQKSMIEKALRAGKPVITATQMLESMIERPRPTRAEASDVANAIFDGSDAVMLSGETATGKYPVETVLTMERIAERAEKALNYHAMMAKRAETRARSVTDAISHATCTVAEELGAQAIITATESGHTTRMVARYRPETPIIAATPNRRVLRKMSLVWGATPVYIEPTKDTDDLFNRAIDTALAHSCVKEGDMVVITAGIPAGVPGTTNMVKVHTVGNVVLHGTGIGQKSATGRVRIVRSAQDAAKFIPGEILVAVSTHAGLVPLIEKASGVIAEEGGLSSHAAVVCLSLGVPVIVGAGGATGILRTGEPVTLDPPRGLVYMGTARV
jgi:pyruvate kinase